MRISDWSSDVCSSDLQVADKADGLARKADELVECRVVDWRDVRRIHIATIRHQPDVLEEPDHALTQRFAIGHDGIGGSQYVAVIFRQPVPACLGYTRPLALIVFHVRHRSEEHTSELQSLMRISYAVFCL